MRHCWRLSSQVSLSYRCKTRDRACFRKTFISLLHASIGRNRPCAYLCRLSRHFAQSSSQQSLLGRRAASSPGMHQECSICSHSLPPRQVHSELLPLGPVDAELLPQLCRLCCSAWQEQIQSTQDHLVSFRLDEQRQRPGAKLSHPQVQSQLRGWRETISPAEPGKKKLPRLFVARGLEETSVILRVAGTLEKLSVRSKPLKPRRQPLQTPLGAAPLPLPGQPQLAVSQHLPGGAAPGTDTEQTGTLSGPLPPGLSGLGTGRRRELRPRGRRQPGGCQSPQTAGGEGRAGRRGRRLSLAPEGHQPHSSLHPGLHL